MSPHRQIVRSVRRALSGVIVLALVGASSATAASADTGVRDRQWTSSTSLSGPTAEKNQSKLWFNDGIWWGDLFDSASGAWHIFRLDPSTNAWVDTGTKVDGRATSWADALWDGSHLYVGSAGRGPTATPADDARLYRFSYSAVTKSYTLDGGFPAKITSGGMDALVIDKDSTGRVWATWTRNGQVWVNATAGSDSAWGTPFALPVSGASGLEAEDLSAVVAFGGRIGVMWSNQVPDAQGNTAMYFAVHRDGDPVATWGASEKAAYARQIADNHMNVKAAPDGTVFAATKTSLSDGANAQAGATLLQLLRRNPTTGAWTATPISTVGVGQTRAIVALNPSQDQLSVFATSPTNGGSIIRGTATTAIFSKTTTMSNPSFASTTAGTPFIQSSGDTQINNATTTKQPVSAASGLVVEASDNATKWYLHNRLGAVAPPPPPPPPPTSMTFPVVEDATIDASAPSTNFGSDVRLRVDNDPQRNFLLKFTVAGTGSGTSCPSISSARLRLTVGNALNDNADKGGVFSAAASSNWSQSTVTWSNAPAVIGPAAAAITTPVALSTTYTVDLTPLVTGNGTITIRATGNTTDGTGYFSTEGSATQAPQLQITCG